MHFNKYSFLPISSLGYCKIKKFGILKSGLDTMPLFLLFDLLREQPVENNVC